ncbi:MAG: helix-turn-helix domain-containing protein [Candidatus Methylacidiphilales bacterium]
MKSSSCSRSTETPVTMLPQHEWSSLKAELIWIYDRPVHPVMWNWNVSDPGASKGPELKGNRVWLIRTGSVTTKTLTHEYTIPAGSWTMPIRNAQSVSFSPGAHILSIHFLCDWPSGESLLTCREGISLDAARYPRLESLARKLLRHLARQFPERGAGQHIYSRKSASCDDFFTSQALFLQWLAVWVRVELENGARLTRLSSGDDRPFHAARHLNLVPLDAPFPRVSLQRETGLGLMHLNQLFLFEFGLTTRKYWDQRRLEFAHQCLETSRMPMKEIACRLGFRSDSHFVIWFRRHSGSRPGDYRKQYDRQINP